MKPEFIINGNYAYPIHDLSERWTVEGSRKADRHECVLRHPTYNKTITISGLEQEKCRKRWRDLKLNYECDKLERREKRNPKYWIMSIINFIKRNRNENKS